MSTEKQALKAGDVVQLKSGGPDMTISHLDPKNANSFFCQWFNDQHCFEEYFQRGSLKKAHSKK